MASDTSILNTQILKNSIISHLDKEVVWEAILDVTSKAMKPQGERKFIKFRGTIYTDGVGVSVLKQNYDTKRKGGSSSGKSKSIEADEFHNRNQIQKIQKVQEQLEQRRSDCSRAFSAAFQIFHCQQRQRTTSNEDRPAEEDQRAGGLLSFRKMKPSSFINQQQAGKWLANKLREKFGNNAILIFGNRSTGNNPRPYQREKCPIVDRHGLLRCKNQQCLKVVTSTMEATAKIPLCRLWNRDIAATLNFRHILFSLRANDERPERFCRSKKPLSTGSKRKNISSSSVSTSQQTKRPNNPL
ncbi:hypothetical protein G6F37_009660 [Rhizopus arrhizus]|nr:hypothetical protein G6F38_009159 [Rhizopus arrhizus]KAG1154207.1 hypothetical protein G6F37_009660 [Rhizopus arrhizus]